MSNAHKYRPEVQARRLADMSNPEWQRRREMYRKARGEKKRRVAQWNVAWNLAGRPADFPDFDAWAVSKRAEWDAEKHRMHELQAQVDAAHARWLASKACAQ